MCKTEPGKPQGYEETGSTSSEIPGLGFAAQTSTWPNHTYEMEADALAEIGHKGFVVDAEAMTALLYDFATHPRISGSGEARVRRHQGPIRRISGSVAQNLCRPQGSGPKIIRRRIADREASAVRATCKVAGSMR